MADRALKASVTEDRRRLRLPSARSLLGQDWRIGYAFILPMIVLMVGLILWPFINAILMSATALNFVTGETTNVGP